MTDRAERLEQALGTLLLRPTRERLHARLTDGVAGVDPTTYPVLVGLARLGPTAVGRLATEAGVERTVASRYAARLERAGLVERSAGADARVSTLALTPAGRRAVRTLHGRLTRELEAVLAGVPTRDADALVDGLGRLVAALSG